MMNSLITISLILLWILVFLNLVLVLGLSRRLNTYTEGMQRILNRQGDQNFQKAPTLEVGEVMPKFEAQTIDGQLISSDSFLGNYATLIFLSPSCEPCIAELPKLVALGEKVISSRIKLAMVSTVSYHEETIQFLDKNKPNFPVISVSYGDELYSQLKANMTPLFYFFNPSGEIEVVDVELSRLERELKRISALK